MTHKGKILDKYLSRLDVWSMALGIMVGWGAFVMPGTFFLPVAGPLGTIIAMVASTLIMLVIGANFAYLMERSPKTGGVYTFTKEAFGRDHAFISSWFLCLSYMTIVFLNGTALFVVARITMAPLVKNSWSYSVAGHNIYIAEVAASVLAFAGIGFLLVKAKRFVQKLFTVLALTMFAGVLVIAVVCIPHALSSDILTSFGTENISGSYGIFTLVILAPWAFVGFDAVSFDTAHFKFQMKDSNKIIFTSIIVAGFIYAAMAIVGVSFVPDGYASWKEYISALGELRGLPAVPTFNAAAAYMGKSGLVIISITALAAIFTGIIGAYRAALRILSTMAEDHILSKKFSGTTYTILFIMMISITLSLLGRNTLNWFVDLTSFGAVVGFGYTSAAAYKLAKAESRKRFVFAGFAGAAVSVVLVIVQIVPRLSALEAMGSEAFLLLALWCLLGFIFYWRTLKESTLAEFSGMSVSGIVLFSLLIYSSLMWAAKHIADGNGETVQKAVTTSGVVLILIIFAGLAIMMYIQNIVRKRHEAIEREKIRAVESSLAKSRFLFNMSHDIRTPMNAIIGYTNLAMTENDPEVLHGYLSKIGTSSHHLLALINDILEMSRIENRKIELEFVPVDLCMIFDEIRSLFGEQMKEKGIDFSVHTSQVRDSYVWCDRKNILRILLNVVSNSLKFTPAGGRVTAVLYETVSEKEGYGSYEMRIGDTGIGMSKEFVEKIFTAFERERTSTQSGIEGTGLGLAITKSIVDLMDGTIEVLTSPGSGTEVIIRLKFKLADEDEIRRSKDSKTGVSDKQVDFTGKRILLVEDNAINMEIAKMILTQTGFIVDTAKDGKIALDMVSASEAGYYDIILMDIQMPVMDGYEATKAIRTLENKALASIPIVAMTANAFAEDVKAAHDAGMQAHIAKPVDVALMKKVLGEILLKRDGVTTERRHDA
ncbi:amino acid permease [bacterium]|nr:amino acid permease [bacterium]